MELLIQKVGIFNQLFCGHDSCCLAWTISLRNVIVRSCVHQMWLDLTPAVGVGWGQACPANHPLQTAIAFGISCRHILEHWSSPPLESRYSHSMLPSRVWGNRYEVLSVHPGTQVTSHDTLCSCFVSRRTQHHIDSLWVAASGAFYCCPP